MHKAVTGRVEAKKLLSLRRQSDYSLFSKSLLHIHTLFLFTLLKRSDQGLKILNFNILKIISMLEICILLFKNYNAAFGLDCRLLYW